MKPLFADWVLTADAVRATPKKLEKHAALARYLGALDDSDLQIAARLFAGAPFPRRDERVVRADMRNRRLIAEVEEPDDSLPVNGKRDRSIERTVHQMNGRSGSTTFTVKYGVFRGIRSLPISYARLAIKRYRK